MDAVSLSGKSCGSPPEIENGKISKFITNTACNPVVSYECDDGYYFDNWSTNKTCLNSGEWSDESIIM